LLILPDWCPAGDHACDVFAPLQQADERSKGAVTVVWVDGDGAKADEAVKIVRHNHLTVTVVIDARGASRKAWRVQAWPYWVLLDSRGRVLEARLKPQTSAQLEQMLAKATR